MKHPPKEMETRQADLSRPEDAPIIYKRRVTGRRKQATQIYEASGSNLRKASETALHNEGRAPETGKTKSAKSSIFATQNPPPPLQSTTTNPTISFQSSPFTL